MEEYFANETILRLISPYLRQESRNCGIDRFEENISQNVNRPTPFLGAKSSYKDKYNLGQCNKDINLQIETLRLISKFISTVVYQFEYI